MMQNTVGNNKKITRQSFRGATLTNLLQQSRVMVKQCWLYNTVYR